MERVACLVLTLALCGCAVQPHPGWEETLPQHINREYFGKRPRTRYSHTATVVGDEVVIAFGYYYDHWDKGGPTWHPDVWGLATEPVGTEASRWRLITDKAGSGKVPTPRMNHVAIALPGDARKLIIFGGSGFQDVKYNDVWELDVSSGAWKQRVAVNTPPEARNCFSGTLVGNGMLVYGGFHLGDLWQFELTQNKWELLMDTPELDHAGHPGKRAGHSAVATADGSGMYVYGGFRFENDVSDTSLGWGKLEDMWFYNRAENSWQKMEQVGGTQGGRQFLSMELVPWWKEGSQAEAPDGQGLAVFGGTQCRPKCNLVGTLSVYSLDDKKWYLINVDNAPMHRYHHVSAFAGDALWVHGGESFNPHMYHNSISRISWPPPRELAVELKGASDNEEL